MKPARLLIVGDSISLGATEVLGDDVLSSLPVSYVEQLRALLPTWEINCDAALHRTTVSAERVLRELAEKAEADVVLLQVGGNDVDIDWRRFVVSGGKRLRSRVAVDAYVAALTGCVSICRELGAIPVLTDYPDFDLMQRVRWMERHVGESVRKAVEAFGPGAQDEVHRRCQEYLDALYTLGDELSVPVVKWGAALSEMGPEVRFGADGVHPGKPVHGEIARRCAETLADLQPMLSPAANRRPSAAGVVKGST